MAGLLAALWLLGLFAAAPVLRTGARYDGVDRLRDALVLGVAIPLVLGLLHLLYPIACWLVLAACIGLACRRSTQPLASEVEGRLRRGGAPYLLIAALALVAWPPLIRPLLDGDSVSYHLPNAASWVQAHGVWTAVTRYWWYPPASELFASAIYAVAGPFAVGWSGFAALALLGFRLERFARAQFAAPSWLADALAAATVTAAPLALQGGSLQNDVWLAAFWLETLWLLARGETAATRATAVTALIKPDGWLFALIAALFSRAPRTVWLAGGGALLLWIARDALLWSHTALSPGTASTGATWSTSILEHGLPALALLARVALVTSPFALLALLAALFAPALLPRAARLAWPATAAVILLLVLPFGYDSSVAQLATGASLRYAAPAVALGALFLLPVAARSARAAYVLLLASSAFGAGCTIALYWNDAPTRTAPLIALLAIGAAALWQTRRATWVPAAGFGAAVLAASVLAADRRPVDFYTDALRVGGNRSGVYAWIERTRPAAIGGWGLRAGVVNVLSPQTRTIDLPDADACRDARSAGVLLVALAEQDRTPSLNRRRLAAARACGPILYDDATAVISKPK